MGCWATFGSGDYEVRKMGGYKCEMALYTLVLEKGGGLDKVGRCDRLGE